MGATLVDAFLRGYRGAWIGLFCLVVLAAAAVLAQRAQQASPWRLMMTAALVSVLSAAGMLAGTAMSIPRLVWRRAAMPGFMMASGDSWRLLRAPSTALLVDGKPEVGIAGADAQGRVRLFGMFSGEPIEGYGEAPAAAPRPGSPRICQLESEECRAWPEEWPEPTGASSGSVFVWDVEPRGVPLAYDTERDRLLRRVEGLRPSNGALAMVGSGAAAPAVTGAAAGWALELEGRLTNEPSHATPLALFEVRRIAGGRFDALRLVAVPDGPWFTFEVERASVSLGAAPAAFAWFGRPLLLALVLWFPAMAISLQVAPAWWAARRRKRMAAGEPVSEMPAEATTFQERARTEMARRLHGASIFAVGLALAAPAVVAVVAVVAER